MSNELNTFEEMSKFEKKQKQLLTQALDQQKIKQDRYFAQKSKHG